MLALCIAIAWTGAAQGADPKPRSGLSPEQRAAFGAGLALFKRAWPLTAGERNEDRCSDCHFRPGTGGGGHVYNANVLAAFTFSRPLRSFGIEQFPADLTDDQAPGAGHAKLLHFDGGPGATAIANAMSRRVARALHGMASIEAIPTRTIRSLEDPDDRNGDGISGRFLGRFGSQGQWNSVPQVVRQALTQEVGVAPANIRQSDVAALVAFIRGLRDPVLTAQSQPSALRGWRHFHEIGCDGCHRMEYTLPNGRRIQPFSDFLVHDMGPCLDDGVALGRARSYEWRTAPLWGMHDKGALLLHDGRGARPLQAIEFHCGEATASRMAFHQLSRAAQTDLRLFLNSLRLPR